jgi:hypothetical protein
MRKRYSTITYEERGDLIPPCPSCGTSLDKICYKRARSVVVARRIYFCPECLHALPISYEV